MSFSDAISDADIFLLPFAPNLIGGHFLNIGCKSLDELTDGLLEGSITQIYGEFATGKTTYCLQAAATVSKVGKKSIYIDTENGFSPERAIQIGGRDMLKDILLYYPDDLDQQTNIIVKLETSLPQDVGLIIVDSIVSLYKVKAIDVVKRIEMLNELSLQMLVLSRISRKRKIPVVITNHVYDDFDRNVTVPIGGQTLKYWSKVIMHFKKGNNSDRVGKLIRHPYKPGNVETSFQLASEGITNSG